MIRILGVMKTQDPLFKMVPAGHEAGGQRDVEPRLGSHPLETWSSGRVQTGEGMQAERAPLSQKQERTAGDGKSEVTAGRARSEARMEGRGQHRTLPRPKKWKRPAMQRLKSQPTQKQA